MNLDKAIKILTDFEKGERASVEPEVHEALNLGIEAMKAIKKDRFMAHPYCLNSLPGETRE